MSEPDSAVVEQAKGALMLRYGIGSRESLAVLERWALEAQVPLREVADALVAGICLGRVTEANEGTVRWLEQRLRGDVSDVRGEARLGLQMDVRGDERGAAEGSARQGGPVHATGPAPAPSAALETRRWRYTSAVHAARVVRGR